MSASQQTTNYNFPKFAGADKPAWLVDFNGAMDSIDSTIKTVSDLLATLSGTVDTNTDDLAQALTDLATAQSSLTTLQGVVAQNVIDISTLETSKADKNSPTFTGNVILPNSTSIGDISQTELSYINGVTSNIQLQLNNKGSFKRDSMIFTLVPNAINTITHNFNSTDLAIIAINGDTNANNFDITGVSYLNPNQFQFRAVGGVAGAARINFMLLD